MRCKRKKIMMKKRVMPRHQSSEQSTFDQASDKLWPRRKLLCCKTELTVAEVRLSGVVEFPVYSKVKLRANFGNVFFH